MLLIQIQNEQNVITAVLKPAKTRRSTPITQCNPNELTRLKRKRADGMVRKSLLWEM